ncbi:hypothetical protein LINPERHAP1_LOCUS15802 [Linum perenne]
MVVRVSQRSGVRLSSVELQVGLVKGRLGDYFGVTIILDLCFSSHFWVGRFCDRL